jgi:hypothetical protein
LASFVMSLNLEGNFCLTYKLDVIFAFFCRWPSNFRLSFWTRQCTMAKNQNNLGRLFFHHRLPWTSSRPEASPPTICWIHLGLDEPAESTFDRAVKPGLRWLMYWNWRWGDCRYRYVFECYNKVNFDRALANVCAGGGLFSFLFIFHSFIWPAHIRDTGWLFR